eukprot:TRINITY_DN4067_c0_g2_i1.p1 TRINITY_DN4067_c0_g2~~TRINITY_DN4067_c0_g2_i1.p1  ORF type:complete len:276 (+),score=26.32 TRINITY_DN4067_c0_g2_i1:121-948(+)
MEVFFLAEITIEFAGLINNSSDSAKKMVYYFKGTEGSAFKDNMRKLCEPQYVPAKKTTIALFDLLSNMVSNLSEFTAEAIPEIKARFTEKGVTVNHIMSIFEGIRDRLNFTSAQILTIVDSLAQKWSSIREEMLRKQQEHQSKSNRHGIVTTLMTPAAVVGDLAGGFGAFTAATVGGGITAVQLAQQKIRQFKTYSQNLENMVTELYNLYGAFDKLCRQRDKQLQDALHRLRLQDEIVQLEYATVTKVCGMLEEFQKATNLLKSSCEEVCNMLDS